MSKLDDKLRSLKKDIPKISSELDDRVLNAMVSTPKKPRFNWPKWGLIATAATPILAMTIILVVTNQNSSSPLISGGNVENIPAGQEASEFSSATASANTEIAPGGNEPDLRFSFAASPSIAALPDDLSNTYYTYFKLTYATSPAELRSEINKYQPEYQALIEPLTAEMLANEDYFVKFSVALVPFVFSSSEENISLGDVIEKKATQETNFVFTLYSPQEADSDIRVSFYVVFLNRDVHDITTNHNLTISVINSREENAGSVYYHK